MKEPSVLVLQELLLGSWSSYQLNSWSYYEIYSGWVGDDSNDYFYAFFNPSTSGYRLVWVVTFNVV